MNPVCRVVIAATVGVTLCGVAQAGAHPQSQPPAVQPPPPATPPAPPQKPEDPPKFADTIVVTGSKAEEKLLDTTATMSVITSQTIETAPSANFAELLRSIPGINITQVSARDINVTSRAATGTLATGQLAMLDGRTLYQDFFGFVMWDFLPVNFNEVKQIEVIRGPASAVWGANALYGVVNVISKTPQGAEGHERDIRVRRLRPAGRRRRFALVPERHLRRRAERSMVLQVVGRRIFPGCAGASDREDPL